MNLLRFNLFERYVAKQFFQSYAILLLIFSSVFLVFEFLEKVDVFIKEDATILQMLAYLGYKLPFVIQAMSPIAVLIGVLISIGRLSQLSEMTAIRACGASLLQIAHPLFSVGILIWLVVFSLGETIVPKTSQRLEELYYIDIKKKAESGDLSRNDIWFRQGLGFINIGLYDSRFASLSGVTQFSVDKGFKLRNRIDAQTAEWVSPTVGWNIKSASEIRVLSDGSTKQHHYKKLPLILEETPETLYSLNRRPETMSFVELRKFANKLKSEGVPVRKYQVELASKLALPMINVIIILVALPFALTPARSGKMTTSLVAGVSFGFLYYIIHAMSLSLGSAELLPIGLAAWSANIVFILLGCFLLLGAEYR